MSDPTIQFTPREMVQMMEQRPRPATFLADMLVKSRPTTNKTIIEIDQVFGGQVAAAYVAREGGPSVVGKRGYDTRLHFAPYIYEQLSIKPGDLDVRQAGTTVYDDPAAALARRYAGWLADLEDRFIRREEQQIAEALQTGEVAVSGEGVDYTVDFGMKAGHKITLTGADRWTESTSDKMAQLEAWAEMIEDTGAPGPDVLVGERSAMNNLIKDTNVLSFLDNRRVERGEINVALIRGQRATYLGTLRGSGLDIDLYSYQGMYEDVSTGSKVTKRFMNDHTVLLMSTSQDFRFHYARIDNHKLGNFEGMRFPHEWITQDGKNRYLAMESSPLVGFHQPDAVVSVITTS